MQSTTLAVFYVRDDRGNINSAIVNQRAPEIPYTGIAPAYSIHEITLASLPTLPLAGTSFAVLASNGSICSLPEARWRGYAAAALLEADRPGASRGIGYSVGGR